MRATITVSFSVLATGFAPSALAYAPPLVSPAGGCERASDRPREDALALIAFGELDAAGNLAFGGGQSFDELRLDRTEVGGCALFPSYGGIVADIEAIRSADPESLFGIAGDSLVLRLKYAFAFVRVEPGYGILQLEGGLIPDLWVRTIEERYDLRGVTRLLVERAELFDVSDLGASLLYAFFDDRFRVRAAITNGEGLAQIEQNKGKDLTFVGSADVLHFDLLDAPATLAIHGGYRDGSIGAGSGRNHRAFGAVTFDHPRFYATAEYTEAFGFRDRPELRARAVGAAVSASLIVPYLGVFGRFDALDPDLSQADDDELTVEGGLLFDLFPGGPGAAYRLRLYLGYRRNFLGQAAGPIPGAPDAAELNHVFASLEASIFARP